MVRPLPLAPVQLSTRLPEPSVVPEMVAPVTAAGAPNGVAEALVSEIGPAPNVLVSVMRKVYALPLLSPVNTCVASEPGTVTGEPPDHEIEYELIGSPLVAG